MCGIVGYTKKITDEENNIFSLLETIKHRGPDEQNYFENNKVILGHTRLSIVDIKNGNQPYEYGNLVIVFNGEIYNHKEIRKRLESNGYKFDTNSDTEVLLKAYHYYGNSFLDEVNGMYAFVIYNKIEDTLYFSRDFFGIKPLYYYIFDEQFYFSSEIVSLIEVLKLKNISFEVNIQAQKEYLEKGFIYENQIIDNIVEVKKGEFYKYQNGQVTKINKCQMIFSEPSETLETLLNEEIKEQLNADVKVGVLLSGGIDSSLITAISSNYVKNISTYSISFENTNLYDESKYAKIVAKKFSTNHHEYLFNEEVLLKYLPKLIEVIDIPVYDPAMLPMLYLSDQVSKDVKVVLSGDGGDELFAGYVHHRLLKYKPLFLMIYKIFDKFNLFRNKLNIIKRLLCKNDTLESALEYDIDVGLNNLLLRKTDLCSMRYGLEVRVPFLSKKIYNYVYFKDKNSFINLLYGKIPLRKLVSKLINNQIAYKKKQGFRVPIREWVLNGELGTEIKQELTNNLIIDSKVININQINEYFDNPSMYYRELFSIYLLNKWLKKIGVKK